MDDSAKCRYYVILFKDLLTVLGINLKVPDHVIEVNDGNFKGSTTLMVDMDNYEFKDLNRGKLHLKNYL